jgi:hypothetical protein
LRKLHDLRRGGVISADALAVVVIVVSLISYFVGYAMSEITRDRDDD